METAEKSELFLSVIDEHKGILYKIASSYCRDKEDRRDIIQEIVFQLWKSFERYDSRYMYSTWIYRISLNVAISFYRKEIRKGVIFSMQYDEALNAIEIKSEDNDEMDESLKMLKQFISELKEIDRALIILYLEEKSYREIAEITGITQTNVATKIGRIKKILKQKFININH